ncbi:MAG: HEWD family protein [Salinigranum sp.]
MPTGALRKPKKRVCELCGREEVWDDEADSWQVKVVDGDPRVGSPFCIHEWDINGTFVPFEREA